jgi:hypothetical protein
MPRTTSEQHSENNQQPAKSHSPLRYLLAGIVFAGLSAVSFQCAQQVYTRLFCGYTALIASILFALSMTISICAVVSPGMRDAVERAGAWFGNPVASTRRTAIPFWIAPIAFIAASFLLYYRTLNVGFISDDWDYLLTADTNAPFSRMSGFWRPVVTVSFWLDDKIWGHHPLIWHIENVIVYGLTAYLVYLLTREFTKDLSYTALAGALAAVVFMVLPGHVEVVDWLCDRADLYGTFFTVAGLITYLRYRENDLTKYFAASAALLTLGLLSKEAMVALPICVVVAEIWRKRWGNAVILAVLEAAYIAVRAHVIGKLVGGYTDTVIVGTNMTISVMFHLFDEFRFPAGLLILIALVYRLRAAAPPKLRSIAAFAACFALYLAAVAPVLSISPGPEGNRYIFLPSAFSCAILGISIAYLMSERRRVYVIAACLLALSIAAPFATTVETANSDWVKAGDFVKASIARAKAAGSPSILPDDRIDHIGRAYVWRNGTTRAVQAGEE